MTDEVEIFSDPDGEEPVLTDEEAAAIKLLAQNHKIMMTLRPKNFPDKFMARLMVWQNFALDTRLIPPILLPAVKKGDGLECPYCHSVASSRLDFHDADCDWRKAFERYVHGEMQVEKEFGKEVS